MPKPIKKIITKPTAAQEDVQDTLSRLAARAGERKKHLTIGAIAILAILLIASGAYLFNKNASEQAAFLEAEGYKMFNGLYEAEGIPEAERLEQALKNFRDANETSPTAFRHYYVAATLAEMGRHEEAISSLDGLEKKYSSNMTIIPIAKLKRAQLLIKSGNSDQALEALQEFNFLSVKTLKDYAIMETAALLEDLGRRDEAQQYYSMLLREHPDSRFLSLAMSKMDKSGEGVLPGVGGAGIINSEILSVPPIQ